MKEYDYIAFMGRFQCFHNGHMTTLMKAMRMSQKVIILLGSANSPRSYKNPWTTAEREIMIRSCLSAAENAAVEFVQVEDRLYQNSEWLILARRAVDAIITQTKDQLVVDDNPNMNIRIGIIGHNKDETSFYIKEFPDWTVIDTSAHNVGKRGNGITLNATQVRKLLFTNNMGFIESNVPAGIYAFLENFVETDEYQYVRDWYDWDFNEESKYKNVIPYHMNFYTADPIVIQSGHVLMVQRAEHPGKGLLALPGGHVNPTETSFEAALRELNEETSIKVPLGKLLGSYKFYELFDHPERSGRCRVTGKFGRTATIAHCFNLDGIKSSGESVSTLPKVTPSPEAISVGWYPLSKLNSMRSEIFEDHLDIINSCVNKLTKNHTSSW